MSFASEMIAATAVMIALLAPVPTASRSTKVLWQEFETAYLAKAWPDCCETLNELLKSGESLKKEPQKAGYSYLRCASLTLGKKNFTQTSEFLDLAKDLLGDQPDVRPVDAELNRSLGHLALEQGDLPKAVNFFDRAEAAYPDSRKQQDAGLALAKFAKSRYDEGKNKEAEAALVASLGLYPGNREALSVRESMGFRDKMRYVVAGAVALVPVFILVGFIRGRKKAH